MTAPQVSGLSLAVESAVGVEGCEAVAPPPTAATARTPFVGSAAEFSTDGLHRYDLWRSMTEDCRRMVFVMCNPSTADAFVDDPTIRRCRSFALREGFGEIAVVNLWSYRATNPQDLIDAAGAGIDITGGVANTTWIRRHLGTSQKVVVAWGAIAAKVPGYEDRVRSLRLAAAALDHDLYCLGVTQDGYPKHPLARGKSRVANDQPLVRWP